ncbi:hypothetical protein ABFA07_004463 [Porites harrisoni]
MTCKAVLHVVFFFLFAERVNSLQDREKVENLLKFLLKEDNYDSRIRPDYNGGPVVVTVGFFVMSINAINVMDMDFTLDLFLRQQWVDKRLDHGTNETFYLSNHVVNYIWMPDSYFVNAKDGEMHDVTSSNVMVMLAPGGLVKYNARITVKAYCPMNLEDFPMDKQRCPITIESYGYSDAHITFKWETSNGMEFVASNLQMHPQYVLTGMELSQSFTAYVAANWTGVTATFIFERIYSYFIYNVYGPSVIVVIISWVGFVIPRDTPAARVTLAVTAVLTIVTILTILNSSIAKVNYIKKIDVYLICCFLFVFSSLMEYSIILLLSSRMKKMQQKRPHKEAEEEKEDLESNSFSVYPIDQLKAVIAYLKSRVYTTSFISSLDDYSVYLFPAGFTIFNFAYWLNTFK